MARGLYDTWPVFWEAIRNAHLDVLEYSPSQGLEPLRQAIARYYGRLGLPIDTGQILVTTGASEALGFAFSSILNQPTAQFAPRPIVFPQRAV